MRIIIAAIVISVSCATSSLAQCYGDAASSFGCGVSRGNEASLESFGDSRNEVLPEYGEARSISASELFSQRESIGFYRRLYTSRPRNRWAEQAHRDSMNFGARPIREFGNLPFARPRF